MLEARNLNTFYGDSHILHDVSLRIAAGEVLAVLGRNGVGKTTLVRSLVGFTRPRSGEVLLDGAPIHHLQPHEIVRRGVAIVPQGRRMFPSLTVQETLDIASIVRRYDSGKRGWSLERIFDAFPRLRERADTRTGQLSGGEQEMVAVSRALTGYPRLMLLDEPSEGLSPLIVDQLEALFRELKAAGTAMLIVEQQVAFALRIADRVLVMAKGEIVYDDTPSHLMGNAEMRERHLGL